MQPVQAASCEGEGPVADFGIVQLVLLELSTADNVYYKMQVKCCGGPGGVCYLVPLFAGAHCMHMR